MERPAYRITIEDMGSMIQWRLDAYENTLADPHKNSHTCPNSDENAGPNACSGVILVRCLGRLGRHE